MSCQIPRLRSLSCWPPCRAICASSWRRLSRLGRREFGASLSAIAWAAGGLVVSVLAVVAGCAALVSAVILGAIALGLPPWASALIVGLALAAGGAGLARYFVGRLGTVDVTLKETRQSIKETFVWVKTQSNR